MVPMPLASPSCSAGPGTAELIGLLHARRQAIAAALEGVKADCTQLEARGAIGPLDVAMFRRKAMQLEAELHWHDEFDRVLPSLPDPSGKSVEGILDAASVPQAGGPSPPEGRKAKTRRRTLDRKDSSGPTRGTGKRKKS